tara:strand:+ start:2206 stop:4098 length:1893 start_codon:yes stop_codon:yes gene_type:complete
LKFRKDINGLRAIAVIAVVLFHFQPNWVPGGFAGVDVFFVISGYLMTSIIYKGIDKNDFSILNFYIARANRIIPALSVLCLTLIIFGWFFLSPLDYKNLGLHAASSLSFVSNINYWAEAGYFDAESRQKWLLHTWSLSVEWQFYLIYPIFLVFLKKLMNIHSMKKVILLSTFFCLLLSVILTYHQPSFSYYILVSRAWEMMFGGFAFFYPLRLSEKNKKITEVFGLSLIFSSYFLFSEEYLWPGVYAIFPVVGALLVLLAERDDSLITSNYISQKIGSWSYSIYLWHWPIVVAIYYFLLSEAFIYMGILLSILLGFVSYKFIEKIKFKTKYSSIMDYLKCKPIYIAGVTALLGIIVFQFNGFVQSAPPAYSELISKINPSPLRDSCHINSYRPPKDSCEYFEDKHITWAVIGDSHSTEIAYALAEKVDAYGQGIKHFSFSGCKTSFGKPEGFSPCTRWYNESVDYILSTDSIENVVIIHRYTKQIVGGDAYEYPGFTNLDNHTSHLELTKNLDALINTFSKNKKNVYVYYPIPELHRSITQLIGRQLKKDVNFSEVKGTSYDWYKERNSFIISHFDNSTYPKNVNLLRSQDVFCDSEYCLAVKDGLPLYFDHNHPSMLGAKELVDLIDSN